MSEKKSNREAVAKHYASNGFEIQRKRKIKDIQNGKSVRVATIIKYGLQKEAKEAGLPFTEVDRANRVPQAFMDTTSNTLKKKVEAKLEQYDEQIAQMIQAKLEQAKAVSRGEMRLGEDETLTWDLLNQFINQVPNFTYKTKQGYRGILKNIVVNIAKCKPDEDVVNCFNKHSDLIKRIRVAKNPKTGKPYASLGRYYGLPVSLAKNIPEFEDRLTPAARKAYKRELDKSLETQAVKTMERQKDRVINWKELIRARELWRAEAEEEDPDTLVDPLYSWRGYTIMSLYTMTPPLRNDFGCVMLVNSEPRDKKRNYYWPARGLFYLNVFKTMKRYPDEPPIQFNKRLQGVLNTWIRLSKAKKWLFVTKQNKPYSGCEARNKADGFAGLVTKVASRFLQKKGDPPVTINVMRKAKRSSLRERGVSQEYSQQIARLMRHSLLTATTAYMRDAYSEDEAQTDIDSEDDF